MAKPVIDYEELARLKAEGKSNKEIANIMGEGLGKVVQAVKFMRSMPAFKALDVKPVESTEKREYTPPRDYKQRDRVTKTRSCYGKGGYESYEFALTICQNISDTRGDLCVPYDSPCKFCGWYHISKASNSEVTGRRLLMALPQWFDEKMVEKDARGPYIPVELLCVKCNKPEKGKRRLSVDLTTKEYRSLQKFEPDNKSNFEPIQPYSRSYQHLECPEEVPLEGIGPQDENSEHVTLHDALVESGEIEAAEEMPPEILIPNICNICGKGLVMGQCPDHGAPGTWKEFAEEVKQQEDYVDRMVHLRTQAPLSHEERLDIEGFKQKMAELKRRMAEIEKSMEHNTREFRAAMGATTKADDFPFSDKTLEDINLMLDPDSTATGDYRAGVGWLMTKLLLDWRTRK